MEWLVIVWNDGLMPVTVLAGAVILGLVVHLILFGILKRAAEAARHGVAQSLVRHARKPGYFILPLAFIPPVLSALALPDDVKRVMLRVDGIGMILAVTWLAISLVYVLDDYVADRYKIDSADNLQARQIRTQMVVMRRILISIIGLVGLATVLMTFPVIRNVGTGLFASAGLAGLVAGIAARPVLSNLIAGVQIALNQPIRIDDVVVVEGEWGRIEEIGSTFVVVRIWDLRRLILPLTYFIENPFQNWTRSTADILGTVFIYVDYSVPVETVRQELHRILKETPLWDGKVWGVQVTDAKERTVELRALMSASDSGQSWDLRCLVREKMIAFLQERYPGSLPRVRAEIGHCNAPGAG